MACPGSGAVGSAATSASNVTILIPSARIAEVPAKRQALCEFRRWRASAQRAAVRLDGERAPRVPDARPLDAEEAQRLAHRPEREPVGPVAERPREEELLPEEIRPRHRQDEEAHERVHQEA